MEKPASSGHRLGIQGDSRLFSNIGLIDMIRIPGPAGKNAHCAGTTVAVNWGNESRKTGAKGRSMYKINTPPFSGFSPETLDFLRELEKNNDRSWFAKNREDYVKNVAGPMKNLAAQLIPVVSELDPHILTDPKRIVSRIHRDTRFSKDKTPYWTHSWMAFRRPFENWFHFPTYFFEIHKEGYSFGMNIFRPSSTTMRRFREKIDEDPEGFEKRIGPIHRERSFKLETEKYKRLFPCEYREPVFSWYQSRFIEVISRRKPDKTLNCSKLVDRLADGFVRLKSLYDFLWSCVEI